VSVYERLEALNIGRCGDRAFAERHCRGWVGPTASVITA